MHTKAVQIQGHGATLSRPTLQQLAGRLRNNWQAYHATISGPTAQQLAGLPCNN
jgi:hypothetical protein